MAWEERERGGRYYTRSRRVEGRVVRGYVGGGLAGELASEADRIEREQAESEKARQRRELERIEALVAPVLELDEAAGVIARAHLVASGYHRRKGEWRRGRNA